MDTVNLQRTSMYDDNVKRSLMLFKSQGSDIEERRSNTTNLFCDCVK